MKLGSMFTGYAGLDMAVNAALGSHTAWHCEIEPAAVKLLEHHYPNIPNHGDVTKVDWSSVEYVDAIAAGFPCQPVSYAGKGMMQDDPRWLWPHVARAISGLRPRHVFLENVAALVRRGFTDVLRDLAALGFDAEWCCVRASDAGAPHQRARLFLYAWPTDSPDLGCERPGTTRRRGNGPEDSSIPLADSEGIGWRERQPEPIGQQRGSDFTVRSSSSEYAFDWGKTPYAEAIARWEKILGQPAPKPADADRRLDPPFPEWMMGLTKGHITGVPGLTRAQQIKLCGNGVVSQQGEYAYRILMGRRFK